jgi:hypothetical protein
MAGKRKTGGIMSDGMIIGTMEEVRPYVELWERQEAAMARGEDPTLLKLDPADELPLLSDETNEDDEGADDVENGDISDIDDYDDLPDRT